MLSVGCQMDDVLVGIGFGVLECFLQFEVEKVIQDFCFLDCLYCRIRDFLLVVVVVFVFFGLGCYVFDELYLVVFLVFVLFFWVEYVDCWLQLEQSDLVGVFVVLLYECFVDFVGVFGFVWKDEQ